MKLESRNHPCPCGSGRRFKHCCGQVGVAGIDAAPAEPVVPAAIAPLAGSGKPILSIVLPYYRKLAEFRRVLPLNLPYFARPGIEVVLVLDESSDEAEVLALLAEHRGVRWKVVANDVPHPWRPPCKAINVGLRHAAGRYVLVASPESAFVGDVPAHALQVVSDHPQGIAIGRVGFARFDELREGRSLEKVFVERMPPRFLLHTFYGSICGAKAAFEAVGGYDETFAEGGGDDDNIRVRLELAGHALLACPGLRLLHLSFEPRDGGEHFDREDEFRKCTPADVVANANVDWGRDFSRVALASGLPVSTAESAPAHATPAARVALPAGAVVPTGSRRHCDACGRLLHYEPPVIDCVRCQPAGQAFARGTGNVVRPRIGCVMQLHNEERYLEGCLAHVGPYVDGIVALDDGSTDATARVLAGAPKVLDCLANPPGEPHVWRQRENKRRLLVRARELGMDWVLCCDADERYETLFLENLHRIASSFPRDEPTCVSVTLRELWDAPDQYRADGIWGGKIRARFFRVPPAPQEITFDLDQDRHGQWYPDQVRQRGRMVRIHHLFYHLKMIRREDRIKRRDFHNQLDPEHRAQAVGYDYLAEEGAELRLEKIRPGRAYDYATLPAELRN